MELCKGQKYVSVRDWTGYWEQYEMDIEDGATCWWHFVIGRRILWGILIPYAAAYSLWYGGRDLGIGGI
ncbi:MAG: hypothetical protein J7J30_00925 [Candidatus Odinarchaeota archaeon]|nr:hypothetical protein [Candidatus Odinarchaeota archaeon]